jgi:hypothetical protein
LALHELGLVDDEPGDVGRAGHGGVEVDRE